MIDILSMVLDEHGGLYTFGSGASGALGHGDLVGQEFPVKVLEFGEKIIDALCLGSCEVCESNWFISELY